jgi:hypothetical protein
VSTTGGLTAGTNGAAAGVFGAGASSNFLIIFCKLESIQIWGQPRTSATIYFYIPLSFPSSSRRSAPVKIKVHLVIDDDDGHKETITDVGSVAKLLFRAFWRL